MYATEVRRVGVRDAMGTGRRSVHPRSGAAVGRCAFAALVLAAALGCHRDDGEARAAVRSEVALLEEEWTLALPEAEAGLERALAHFRRREAREAAAELRRTATRLETIRQEVDGPSYGESELTVRELRGVAEALESGSPVPASRVDH
ncbi:MAG: hypothetical protein ICV87_02910, partial [Gemmatimonadetes bacterium]|nr:hypothetical protein [Gemmatimonadota bacterium]